jgi:hypothetical protein
MIGMMLIVAARWVQLSKEEFASACEFWSPSFGRKLCLGWDPGLFLMMFRYGDFWCWPKAERWKNCQCARCNRTKQVGFPGDASESRLPFD